MCIRDSYKAYLKVNQNAIDEFNRLKFSVEKHEWINRLTYEQWVDFQNGTLKMFSPLNGAEIINNRFFNYYFEEGDVVVFDKKNMDEYQLKQFEKYIDKEGVVTRCWSDMHAFAQGSAYSVEVSFDGEPMETDINPITFLPKNYLPIGLLIKKITE